MSLALRSIDTSELAFRFLERPPSTEWVVLQVPAGQEQRIADELSEAAGDIDDVAVERVDVEGSRALIDAVHRPGDAIRIVSGLDRLSEDDWQHVDHARSLLAREGCVVLVLSEQSLQRMFRHAPNLTSWIGAAVWSLDDTLPTLSEEEKHARLEALRSWSGLTDAEVIARAEQKALPGDPEYAEWLVLLDRGDLVEPRPGE